MAVAARQIGSGFCCDFAIIRFEFCSDAGEFNIRGIESVAICNDFGDISMELCGCYVLISA